ncbi:MAG: DUF2723 domain-containing protein [Bacteroidetes bacterium]|nr:DUF2723 domain-containing protein [Bacteroidota bacterium]
MDYKRLNTIVGWMVFLFATSVYILTLEPTTSLWDCGEYITTAYKLEVGHPPGAPLFMMLGRLFTIFASPENAAYMVNMMSALSSSFTILFLFWTITMIGKRIVLTPSSVFGAETAAPKKSVGRDLTMAEQWAILGSGLIGAVAYTFSDSFWFSAVEGEVYAMSSFFTAIVIWAIFKWDHELQQQEWYTDNADIQGRNANRWLIFIFFMVGLSIGVHLLNLLCIPAIAYVIYFRKFKETNALGFIVTGIIGVFTLGIVQSVLIPKTVQIAGFFERFFVNDLGMPFNAGTLFFFLFMAGIIVALLLYSKRKNWAIVNTSAWALSMIFIGYSCFAMIVIRSNANTPLDENDPENLVSLESYLKREQYGDWPILYGPYFTADYAPRTDWDDRSDVYQRLFVVTNRTGKDLKGFKSKQEADDYAKNSGGTVVEKYLLTFSGEKGKPTFDPEHSTFLPRMYSKEPHHISGYKSWSGHVGNSKPTMGQNLAYFGSYQVDWMYWRYFMWNFSGRQWDEQGHGGARDGNWISGLNFIDKHHIGDQTNVPAFIENNAAHNKFYMLPLVLGLIGFIFMLMKASKEWWIVMLLFLLTGFAIIIYLNQKPSEPRERDYAYAASFYAFAIYVGLSVLALYQAYKSMTWKELAILISPLVGLSIIFAAADKTLALSMIYMTFIIAAAFALMIALRNVFSNENHGAMTSALLALPIPIMMGVVGWDDHDRSERYTARDLAYNYLISCDDNSIIFTNGDNDTFPLWYLQEVEGTKTSVRVCNLSLLNTDWYTEQMTRQAYDSKPLPIKFTEEQYRQNGLRDYMYVFGTNELTMRSGELEPKWRDILTKKIEYNPDLFKPAFAAACDSLTKILSTTEFAVKEPAMMSKLPTFDTSGTYFEFRNLIFNLTSEESRVKYFNNFSPDQQMNDQLSQMVRGSIQNVLVELNDAFDYLPADFVMEWLRNDANAEVDGENTVFIMPTKGLTVLVDKEKVLANGIVSEADASRVQDKIQWKIPKQSIYKADLMILDIVAHFNWDRAVYFASSAERSTYLGLDKYFYSEGLVYKLVPFPVTGNRNPNSLGEINKPKLYENLMTTFKWGNMETEGVLVDYYTRRLTNNYRVQFSVLADAYLEEHDLHQQLITGMKEVLAAPAPPDTSYAYPTPVGRFTRAQMPEQIKKSEAIVADCKVKIAEVLDRSLVVMPEYNVPYDKVFPSYISTYYGAGHEAKAEELSKKMLVVFEEEIDYYLGVDPKFTATMIDDLFGTYRGVFSIYQAVNLYATNEAYKEEVSAKFYSVTERVQAALPRIQRVSPAAFQQIEQTFYAFFQRIMAM